MTISMADEVTISMADEVTISMADEVINIDNDQEETQRKYKRNYAKYILVRRKEGFRQTCSQIQKRI